MSSNQSEQSGSEGLYGGLNQGAPENAQQSQSGNSQQQGGQSQGSRQSQRSIRDDDANDLQQSRENGLQQGSDHGNRSRGEQSR